MLLQNDLALDDEYALLMKFLQRDFPRYLKSLVNAHAVTMLRKFGQMDIDTIFERREDQDGRREIKTISFGDTVVHVMG